MSASHHSRAFNADRYKRPILGCPESVLNDGNGRNADGHSPLKTYDPLSLSYSVAAAALRPSQSPEDQAGAPESGRSFKSEGTTRLRSQRPFEGRHLLTEGRHSTIARLNLSRQQALAACPRQFPAYPTAPKMSKPSNGWPTMTQRSHLVSLGSQQERESHSAPRSDCPSRSGGKTSLTR